MIRCHGEGFYLEVDVMRGASSMDLPNSLKREVNGDERASDADKWN
jgi:hypothetical protein